MDNDQPTLMDTMDDSHERDYMYDHAVNLDELCKGDGEPAQRLRLVKEVAKKQRFFHWAVSYTHLDVYKRQVFFRFHTVPSSARTVLWIRLRDQGRWERQDSS